MPFRWSDFPVQIVHCVTGSDDFKAEVSFLLPRPSSIPELFHQQQRLTPFHILVIFLRGKKRQIVKDSFAFSVDRLNGTNCTSSYRIQRLQGRCFLSFLFSGRLVRDPVDGGLDGRDWVASSHSDTRGIKSTGSYTGNKLQGASL